MMMTSYEATESDVTHNSADREPFVEPRDYLVISITYKFAVLF